MDCKNTFKGFENLLDELIDKSNTGKNGISFRKNETLVKQGVMVNHMMYIKSGLVKLEYETETGTVLLDIIPGENLLCLSGLFGNNIAHYSVIALSDTLVHDLKMQDIEEKVRSNGDFASRVIRHLNAHNHHLYKRISSLNQKQMNGRVADVLLFLADNVFDKDEFPMYLSRRDLGNFSGMAMMSVIRTLQSIKNDGIVSENSGRMIIHDKEKLRQLSENG